MIPSPLLILATGATARLTRLVTKDKIAEPPREWIKRRTGEKIGYLLGCPWCASFWIALPVAALTVWRPRSRAVWAAWLALSASQASGLGANLDIETGDDDPDFAAELTQQQLERIVEDCPGTAIAAWADGHAHERLTSAT